MTLSVHVKFSHILSKNYLVLSNYQNILSFYIQSFIHSYFIFFCLNIVETRREKKGNREKRLIINNTFTTKRQHLLCFNKRPANRILPCMYALKDLCLFTLMNALLLCIEWHFFILCESELPLLCCLLLFPSRHYLELL